MLPSSRVNDGRPRRRCRTRNNACCPDFLDLTSPHRASPHVFRAAGVCDCCDGSDEYSLVVQCANTCVEDGREAREAARLAHDLQTKGYNIKLDYAEEGQALRDVRFLFCAPLESPPPRLTPTHSASPMHPAGPPCQRL